MEKSYLKLKKKYNILRLAFALFAALYVYTAYQSYDYWVFKTLITRGYIFDNDLDELYLSALGEENFALSGNYAKDFDKVVMASVTADIRGINADKYTYLYTPRQYSYSKEYEKKDALLSQATELSPETVLVNLPNFSKGTKDFLFGSKKSLAEYENIIIDLRHNYGGFLPDCYKMAGLFLDKGDVLGSEITRFSFYNHEVKSKTKPYFSFNKIIILQDENTASAAETFILALKGNMENVTTIGKKTYGKGIGQVTIPLTGGYAVKATVLLLSGPDMLSIHNVGVEPDIFYESDDIIEYAFGLIDK